MRGVLAACFGSLLVVACASPQRVLLTAAPDQQSIVRNGVPILVSNKKHLVMLRANTRLVKDNARPAFTVIVRNQGKTPDTLREASIQARQMIAGKMQPVRIFRYDELIQEEETRQKVAAFGAAVGGFARAMSAANAGNVNTTGTVVTQGPYGNTTYGTYTATTYDPVRAQIAQEHASNVTHADFERIRAQGEANMQRLDATILKDNTVLPGEWFGGTIVLAPLAKSEKGNSDYTIIVAFGGEEHTFAVSQVAQ